MVSWIEKWSRSLAERFLRVGPVLFSVSILLFFATLSAAHAEQEEAFAAMMQEYCVRCHGGEKTEAAIDLSGSYGQLDLLKRHEVWDSVLDQLYSEEMPPRKPLPGSDDYKVMVDYVESRISKVDWTEFHDPGRLGLARLTTVEYRNSIRDIFGVDLQAGAFLGKDPEGNTGFTNDRDSLSFPLFAFDNFMREAERVTDSWLNYAREPWEITMDAVESWKSGSDASVELNDEESAVKLKERNAPFQMNLDLPFMGLYELTFRARVGNSEPISAMRLMMNGSEVERFVVRGKSWDEYSVVVNLPRGANVVSLGYDPDRAPLITEHFEPRYVPKGITKKVQKPTIPSYPIPEHFRNDEQAKRAWKKLNNTIKAFLLTQRLAEHLIQTDRVDFEMHRMVTHSARQVERFGPSKVPFNLAAGSVAVFEKIPQAKLEKKIKEVTGFSHSEYAEATKAYLSRLDKKYPERARKTPGRVEVAALSVSSHALDPGVANPASVIEQALVDREAAHKLLDELATKAYARRPQPEEMKRLLRIYEAALEETGSTREALHDAMVGLLVSPPFLLRYYQPGTESGGRIESHDLAERLSRFLWLSIPDQEIRALAANDELHDPEVLSDMVERMIKDPKFDSTATTFVEQWLNLESLAQFEDSNKIRSHIVLSMKEEPVLLFLDVFRNNRSLLELIDSDFTYLNASLAHHYDMDGVLGDELRRVPLEDKSRGGLMAMAAVLTNTSTPERTSPVNRGAFIVELILGEHLPPPPPNVPELQTDNTSRTIREELERHRDDKACSGCHDKIDPYGFVLENYDQFGAWRRLDRGQPILAATTLDDGTEVDGLIEFKRYLIDERRDDFLRNVTERLFEFALGRKAIFSDEAMIRDIMTQVEEDDYRAQTLIREIVLCEAFQAQSI